MDARIRRVVLGALFVAVLVAGLAVAVLGNDGADDEAEVEAVAGSSLGVSTTTPSTSTSATATTEGAATSTVVSAPAPTTATSAVPGDGSVEITVSVDPAVATVGERVELLVTATNRTGAEVYGRHVACAGASVFSTQVLLDAATNRQLQPTDDQQRGWDGDVDGLAEWLGEHNAEPWSSSVPEAQAGFRRLACFGGSDGTAGTTVVPIPADGALTERHVFELRLRPGDPVPAVATASVVQTRGNLSDEPQGGAEPEIVAREGGFELADAPGRSGTDGAAVDAFAADPRLGDWVDDSRSTGTTDWTTALAWWRGAWELRVQPTPLPEACGFLRMRYDPSQASVVDVRQVACGQVPMDEPGRIPVDGDRDDVVYP